MSVKWCSNNTERITLFSSLSLNNRSHRVKYWYHKYNPKAERLSKEGGRMKEV